MTKNLTPADIREVAAESGLDHAEMVVVQTTGQIGREAAEPLWTELAKLRDEAWVADVEVTQASVNAASPEELAAAYDAEA